MLGQQLVLVQELALALVLALELELGLLAHTEPVAVERPHIALVVRTALELIAQLGTDLERPQCIALEVEQVLGCTVLELEQHEPWLACGDVELGFAPLE